MSSPLASFVLLTYNQEGFIREAVEGAFSQTYSPLEIILSDDCSSDSTFAIMKEMATTYTGPHKIVLNRNSENMGLGRHYSKLMELATGEIVVIAAGDDVSLPHRTTRSVEVLAANLEIISVSLGLIPFSGESIPEVSGRAQSDRVEVHDIDRFLTDVNFHLNAPARAFRKFSHDYFGPFIDKCPVEDGPNLLRSFLHGKAAFSPTDAVLYRVHEESVYSAQNRFKISFEDIYEDYENTIRIAEAKGLIASDAGEGIRKKLKRRLSQRLVIMKVESSRVKLAACVCYVFPSRHFSLYDKLRFFYEHGRLLLRTNQ